MSRSAWLVVMLLVLTSCAPSAQVRTPPTPTWGPLATSTPTATPPPLGPLPQHCPVSTLHESPLLSGLAPVIGASPVYATWPTTIFHLTPTTANSLYAAPYGWQGQKVIWEVGPSYAHPVTIRGEDTSDHTPLLFQFLNDTPTADAVLDPQHPDHPVSVVGADWAEWGSYIVPPKAGCYAMEVSWPTGHWDITFAFGT